MPSVIRPITPTVRACVAGPATIQPRLAVFKVLPSRARYVLHDLIGVFPGKRPRFAKNFMEGAASIDEAVTRYVTDVRESRFPGPEHSY